MLQKIIAISGGIGSGKSVVSRLLRTMGYEVYDCDSEAKTIMDRSVEMHVALVESFGEDENLVEKVFEATLNLLNERYKVELTEDINIAI